MASHGKKYRAARGQIDREQAYSPLEAIQMIKAWEGPKFDETVEAHVRLGLNVRHADQQLRGTLMLPHGMGKELPRCRGRRRPGHRRPERHRRFGRPGSASKRFIDFDVRSATRPDGGVGKLADLGSRG
jgi:hypothetical protein